MASSTLRLVAVVAIAMVLLPGCCGYVDWTATVTFNLGSLEAPLSDTAEVTLRGLLGHIDRAGNYNG